MAHGPDDLLRPHRHSPALILAPDQFDDAGPGAGCGECYATLIFTALHPATWDQDPAAVINADAEPGAPARARLATELHALAGLAAAHPAEFAGWLTLATLAVR